MSGAKLKTIEQLQAQLEELHHQLFEAHETIEAIRTGQIDALVVQGNDGHQLYTLKTADQSYRVFIEKMTEGALTLDKEGIILYCNSQFASMVEQPLSNVLGIRLEQFIAPEDKASYNSVIREAWSKDLKKEISLQAGTRNVPVQLSLTALELDEERRLIIILTDLTLQKRTQRQLQRNNQRLAEMNRALELSNHDLQQFASVASHDLQEPLRKIQMFSNLLIERAGDTLSSDSQKYVEKIVYSAARMKALVIDVLNYSKLSAQDNPFQFINLNEVVHELLDDFELIIQEKHATVTVGELPQVRANRGQIRQVFQNIVSNALKFSRKTHPPDIQITAKRLAEKSFDSTEQEDGPYCLISVRDNGIGFDEKYLDHIFALFERLHSKDTYEGTGIGLAIANKIMEKHKGLISARSNPGHGSEFMILLPIDQG